MHTLDPDRDILLGLQAGDERALRELMRRHIDRIHGLAARLLGDPVLAEDVTQTVFLKTWEMAPNWQSGQAKLGTWMQRVTTHHCLDILKKKQPIYTDDVPDVEDSRRGVVDQLIDLETGIQVKAALDALPYRQKAALVLSYYEDVSQKQGADILNLSEKAYESLLVRGRQSLKRHLEALQTVNSQILETQICHSP